MKNFIFVLLTIFFVNSCNSIQRKAVCNEVTNYQVNETTSFFYRKGKCYAAPFDVNNWEVLEDYIQVDLERCDGLQGVNIDYGILEITPKFTALQRIRSEQCR
jgi:hypothetical protein